MTQNIVQARTLRSELAPHWGRMASFQWGTVVAVHFGTPITADSGPSNLPLSIVGPNLAVPSPVTGFGQAFQSVNGGYLVGPPGSANASGAVTGSAFTAECRWTPAPITGNNQIIMGRSPGSASEWSVFMAASQSNLTVNWYDSSGTLHQLSGATALVAGTSYAVALSWDGSVVRLFVNGNLDAQLAVGTAKAPSTGVALQIGGSTTGGSPSGQVIDEIRISNSARYTATYTPATSPFTSDGNTGVLYHLDVTPPTVDVQLDGSTTTTTGLRYLGDYFPFVGDSVVIGRMQGPAQTARFVLNRLAQNPNRGGPPQLIDKIGPLSAAQASVSFPNLLSAIPQNFSNLEIRQHASNNYGGAAGLTTGLRFNGDSGANYDYFAYQAHTSSGASVLATLGEAIGASYILSPSSESIASTYPASDSTIRILNYSGYGYKHVKGEESHLDAPSAGNFYSGNYSGLWIGPTPVTQITLLCNAGITYLFTPGSTWWLYGY